MARPLAVSVERLESTRTFVGLELPCSETSMFEDAPKVARAFGSVKESMPGRAMPVTTIACVLEDGSAQSYFMGDEVAVDVPAACKALRSALSELEEPAHGVRAHTFEIPAGTQIARVSVRVGSQATLPLEVARLRARVRTEWMPEHGYGFASALRCSDMEVYRYRRRRFRKATKLVMELVFPIERLGQA